MTKKTKRLGRQTGKSSDKFMSPQKPYTGDGHTVREIFDKVTAVFKPGKS